MEVENRIRKYADLFVDEIIKQYQYEIPLKIIPEALIDATKLAIGDYFLSLVK